MDPRFPIGILGSILLVAGAAFPSLISKKWLPKAKNFLFASGNACMFLYALLGWLAGGSVLFLILQIYIATSTVLMLLDVPDRYDTPFLTAVGVALVAWSLTLFEGYATVLFIMGIVLLGIGFASADGTVRRNLALALGSAVIAVFSYLESDWIFTIVNILFAFFSGLALKKIHTPPKISPRTA